MSKIDKEKVKEVAYLARLELTEKEVEKFQGELSDILGYVETIQKVDTKDVEPTAQVTGLTDVWRVDKKSPSNLSRDEILANTPEKQDGYIKVKPVLE
ncbi:MAG: Asp-tRNA(Asn)/Glu-tRNA(Gln) amidotransferase subunit GatC [Patescibacteria group bacterium]|nr:Asp-tRNA(Asn)/Glu-tRNA(Gln) amidotransferase subunit GatC [Patescibacteria group bacterium]